MSLSRNVLAMVVMATMVGGSALAQDRERPRRGGAEGGRPGPGGPGGPAGRGGPGGPGAGFMRMLPVLAALDADKDGKLSSEEIANATAALKTLDKNNDGQLTADEMRPQSPRDGDAGPRRGRPDSPEARRGRPDNPEARGPQGGRGPEFLARMFDQRDANDDGKLSGDEIPEQLKARVERIDTDGDGAISKAEMQAMAERFGGAGQRGRGRGGDQGGRPGGDRPQRPQAEDDE